ncbi:MAG: S-layer homology domain-containing protein [Eubacteriales bacterium]
MDMKRRILSCFLAFCMIFALLPAPAQAVETAGNAENATPTVTATVQHAETGQITAQIEAYMTDPANKTRTVKPCDIIFLIEQSKFMNTQNGSANSGDERAEILSAIDRLLDGMPQPTTGGKHRIAIAGYGRINNPGIGDSYDAALYPGTLSSSNASLNTGYYTKDDTKGVFHSQSGWTECDFQDDASLPQLPSGYLTDKYDNVFLSVGDAKQVIDADKMVPWYAGAARMDAGLTITEQLAEIAKEHKAAGEDRNLIVCIAASSLPYQNSSNYQKLRPDAAKAAAKTLKETYGATIFGLGDFHKLNLESSNPLNDADKQRDNFNDTMASICGNASTNGADYFKGLSQVHDIDEALNELMTKIDANVGEGASEKLSIDVDNFTEGAGKYSWSQLKHDQHILSAGSIREVASVDYYRFTGYDSSGTPLFESTPSRHTEQSLADIGGGDAIQTSLNILPIPPQAHAGEIRGANYGEKVVITITDPVCIDYQWIGRWQPDIDPPKHEHAARATTHKPAAPTQNAVAGKDLNLKFDGWYTDEQCTQPFVDGTVLNTDTVLYGRWKAEHGNLSVAKTVAGNNGDTSKAFNFTVTLSDTGINGKFGEMNFANGVATFVLKHGESKTAVGLPAGITYTVTEAEADKDGYTTTSVNASGSIIKDDTAAVTFTNTRNSSSSHHSTRYTLHYESNGGTAYKDERYSSGTKVTLDKTPTRESYTFTGWYADKALTQKITSVTMNSDKTVYAGWEATGVPDKLNGDDHFAYVIGYPDGKVHPKGNISRAETATIFFRLLKADIRDGNLTADNDFSDVSDGQWHNKAISTMAKLGIVKGRRADSFDPDASITRAEFAAICARFNTKPVENSGSFSDISGHWAENEIERAAAFGWISGYPDGTFHPDARITRAEAMTMINRVLCRMPQSKSDLLDSMVTWPDNKPSDWHYLAVQEATNSHDFNRQGEVGESWTKLTSVPDWTRYQ